jgi:N-methylhydantoinase B
MRSGFRARKGVPIRFWEGGGGGWGDPRERPAEWVLDDVIDGFVTLEAARDVYGVAIRVVDEDAARYDVDDHATATLRGS